MKKKRLVPFGAKVFRFLSSVLDAAAAPLIDGDGPRFRVGLRLDSLREDFDAAAKGVERGTETTGSALLHFVVAPRVTHDLRADTANRRVYQIATVPGVGAVTLDNVLRRDTYEELYDHPYRFGASLMLTGGYDSHRLVMLPFRPWFGVHKRTLRAGSLSVSWPWTRERVGRTPSIGGTWELRARTPEVRPWFYTHPTTLVREHHARFEARKQAEQAALVESLGKAGGVLGAVLLGGALLATVLPAFLTSRALKT